MILELAGSPSKTVAGADKLSVLFVDDEVNILNGLKRSLYRCRDHWDMRFATGARQALALLGQRPADMVVSDMRMPDLDGAELLSRVEGTWPGSVRVILSGFAEEETILRTAGPSHIYLAKPCEVERIIHLMERVATLRGILGAPRLREAVAGLHGLPTLPEHYTRLVTEMRREEASADSVARILAEDMAMTATILKVANSAYFSFVCRVNDIFHAVRLLGFEKVRGLALNSGLLSMMGDGGGLSPLLARLNHVALERAALIETLVRQFGGSAEMGARGFTAGMLSPLGSMMFLHLYPDTYPALLGQGGTTPLAEAEQAAFGGTSAEIGAYLMGLWGFDDDMVEAVLYQDTPKACVYQGPGLLAYVHVARSLVPLFDPPSRCQGAAPGSAGARGPLPLDEGYLAALGLPAGLRDWQARLPQEEETVP